MTAAKRQGSSHRLTDTAIKAWLRNAQPDTRLDGSDLLHDGGGLYLRRRSDGAYWALRQVNALTKTRTWSAILPGVPYPQASLADARRRATDARTKAADGPTDLVRDRRAKLAAARAATEESARRITVRTLFEQWQRAELTPQILADGTRTGRKDGGEWVKQSFERRVFSRLGHVHAQEVKRADLLAILDDAKADGLRRTANVLLADLRQMFRFAAERDIVQRNPLEGIKRASIGGKDTERDRILSDDELRTLWRAVPDARMSSRSAIAVWLILSTAARVGEAMGARWDHVDLRARTWYLPTTKNERDHTIHLSDFALQQFEALAALREVDGDGKLVPWVFPATDRRCPVCVKSFGKQLADRQREPDRRISGRSKNTEALRLPGGRWTAHDLRRTAATLMAQLGVSTDVIDECLNHKLQSKVARVYIHDRREADQRRAFDALGVRLTELFEGAAAGSNVVPLRVA